MIQVSFNQAPSTDGIDFSDDFQSRKYEDSQNEWIRSIAEQLARKANEPRYIRMPDGRTLDELDKDQPWPGVVWMVDTTLSEAYRQAGKHNFQVMDGSGGAADMRDQFVRGAAANQGAGVTGGAVEQVTAIAIANHDAHHHWFTKTATTGVGSTCCKFMPCGAGPSASLDTHTHSVTVQGDTCDNTVGLDHSITQDTIATLPPFYTMIFVRRN